DLMWCEVNVAHHVNLSTPGIAASLSPWWHAHSLNISPYLHTPSLEFVLASARPVCLKPPRHRYPTAPASSSGTTATANTRFLTPRLLLLLVRYHFVIRPAVRALSCTHTLRVIIPSMNLLPEAGRQTVSTATTPRKVRDPYLDNAKAILITLVVIGHPLNSVNSYLGGALETWIYAFHMPAFVMISGYLSRSYRNEPRQTGRLLSSLLVPYMIFQLIHACLRVLINGSDFNVNMFHPSWTLWFLLALFIWRLCTPLLKSLRYPLAFAVA